MAAIKEHAYIKIGKDIKTGRIPGLVVLHGEEQYLVNFYGDLLVKKFVNEATKSLDLVELDRDNMSAAEVIENLETISMLSERKVVLIRNFIDAKGKLPKNMDAKSNEFKTFAEYIKSVPDSALLILTAAKQEDTSAASRRGYEALIKKICPSGKAYDFTPLDPPQLRGFIEKRFHGSGKAYRPAVIELILRECGYGNKNIDYGLYELENDLKKIIAHCGAAPEITKDDVIGVIASNPENDVFGMIEAIAIRRKDRALKLLHNIMEDGGSEFAVLALLTKQLEIMLIAREMKDEGMSGSAIEAALSKSHNARDFVVRRALTNASKFRTEDLKRILSAAYDIDYNIKSGLYSGTLALELFIAGI